MPKSSPSLPFSSSFPLSFTFRPFCFSLSFSRISSFPSEKVCLSFFCLLSRTVWRDVLLPGVPLRCTPGYSQVAAPRLKLQACLPFFTVHFSLFIIHSPDLHLTVSPPRSLTHFPGINTSTRVPEGGIFPNVRVPLH